jgi:general secretion pathway protein M
MKSPMKLPTLQTPQAWQDLRERLSEFWQERNARERTILRMAGALLLLALVYLLLLNPPLSGRAQLDKTLPQLRQQAAELQSLAATAAQLAQQPPSPFVPATPETIAAALARQNLKAQSVLLSGDILKVQLTNASFAALVSWLDEQQRTSRLVVTEAAFDVQPALDMVNATLTLRRQVSDKPE